MAETTKGIYYTSNYASVADVPADMKKMAESIEKVIRNEAYDDTQIKQDISELKQKNTEQDESIESLQKENAELKAENERLNNDINAISVTERAEGENITLKDTAEARFKKFGIGGNSWQETREGYNLIPFTYETKTANGVTFTVNGDGTIKVDGTATANTYFDLGKPTLPAGDYILTGLPSAGSSSTFKITFKFEDTQQNLFGTDGKTFTINSEATAQENYLFIASGYTANNLVFKPMIAKGTTIKDYEQYGTMPSPNYKSDIQNVTGSANVTICNKNLFDIKRINNLAFGTMVENTILKTIIMEDVIYRGYSLKLDKNQRNITISRKNITDFNRFRFGFTEVLPSKDVLVHNSKWSKEYIEASTLTNITLTIPSRAKYLVCYFSNENEEITEEAEIQIEYEEKTSYVPHQSQTFTFPLQEGQRLMKGDYLADDGIHHVRKQRVFDGTEDWIWRDTTRYSINLENIGGSNSMCSHYTYKKYSGGVTSTDKTFCVGDDLTYIGFFDAEITSLTKWKEYLAEQYANGTPVVVEYDLAEEEIESYIPEQQAVHNEIKKTVHSYGEQTHIFSADETSLIFNVEARKDMNTVISNLESMIISNASEEV